MNFIDDPNVGPQRFDRNLAKSLRKLQGEPEPFCEDFQERFLQTLVIDADFRAAVRNILEQL